MDGDKQPTVCLGMPLYNQTEFLVQALESLLAQSYRNFRLVIVDDSTSVQPGKIVRQLAAEDERIHYVHNASRKGLVDNWRACFLHAGEADYFAWVSDHDIWHPEWLGKLVHTLNTSPNAVLAYPVFIRITTADDRINKPPRHFSTTGLSDFKRVLGVSWDAQAFGKMVYGLFRASALRRAGIFRRILFPDVVLLFEISLQGDIVQVDEELWSLRRMKKFSIARQKMSLFTRKPWYIYLPWPLVNTLVLGWHTVITPYKKDPGHRYLGFVATFMYLYRNLGKLGEGSWIGSYREWTRGKKPWMKKLIFRLKQAGQPR